MHIPEFKRGSHWRGWRAQLNAIVRALRDLTHLRGDGLVKVDRVPGAGYTFGLNVQALKERLPNWRRRHGVAQIDSNDASGAYTITEQIWNPDAGPAAWEDGTAPDCYVGVTARDYQDRDTGAVDGYVRFWEQRDTDGTLEILIDVMGGATGEPSWGKATAAWTTGNTVTLDPCSAAEVDNGLPNVTAYIVSPTGKAITYADIAADDIVAYLPYGDNLGVVVGVLHGGTATSVDDLLPTGANFETETAQTDTWDRASQGGSDGLTIRLTTRIAYDHTGDEKLYAFYREFKYDSNGQLMTISAETRKEIDAPGECETP